MEKAIKLYFEIISGDTPASRWVFITSISFVIAALVFVVFNYNPTSHFETGYGFSIYYNNERLFLFYNADPQVKFGESIKIVEFIVIWLASSGVTAITYGRMYKHRLRDALSPLRDEIYGDWLLSLEDDAGESIAGSKKIIDVHIRVAQNKAEKLLINYESNQIAAINGNTSHVSLVVNDESSSRIEISFPLNSNITIEGRTLSVFLYIVLWYTDIDGTGLKGFSGHWYSITDLPVLSPSGPCKMIKSVA